MPASQACDGLVETWIAFVRLAVALATVVIPSRPCGLQLVAYAFLGGAFARLFDRPSSRLSSALCLWAFGGGAELPLDVLVVGIALHAGPLTSIRSACSAASAHLTSGTDRLAAQARLPSTSTARTGLASPPSIFRGRAIKV